MSKLLEGKNAVVYGGGGGIGGGVARTFAREGATVFLAGRTREPLEAVAGEIRASGGAAEVAVLDALDAEAVDAHVAELVVEAGSLDVSLNLSAAATSRAPRSSSWPPTTCCARPSTASAAATSRRARPRGR